VPFVADLRTVLGGGDFRRLFAVRLTSQSADGAFQVALASLVFFSPERAATPRAAAAAFAVTALPYTLVGPFAGVLLDRWPRRQVLVLANAARAVLVLGVAALLAGLSVGPALYVAVLACLSVNRFFLTALGAGLPHVVPRRQLVMANAVSPTSGTLAALAGGGLAFLVRAALPAGDAGDAALLCGAAGGYLLAAALATRMPRDLLGPDRPTETAGTDRASTDRATADRAHTDQASVGWRAVLDGGRHLRGRPPAPAALAVVAVSRCGYGVITIATVLLCRNYFNDPTDAAAGLALLARVFVASAVGFALAALVTPPATDRWGTSGWTWRCLIIGALAQVMLLAHLSVPAALLAAVLLGLAVQGIKICADATLQRVVDDAYRGRVFATYDAVFNLAFVLAAVCAALAVPPTGRAPGLTAIIAALYLAAALGFAFAVRRTPAARTTSAATPGGPPPR
jgi:MFS family permease